MNTARLEVKRGFLTTRTLVMLINIEVLERNVEENEVTEQMELDQFMRASSLTPYVQLQNLYAVSPPDISDSTSCYHQNCCNLCKSLTTLI